MALAMHHFIRFPTPAPAAAPSLKTVRTPRLCSIRCVSRKAQDPGNGESRRRIWRRRRLTKNDDKVRHISYDVNRVPFIEEQALKIKENAKLICMDIEKLLLSEENRFDFVNEVAAEATAYLEANKGEYGTKKPILHALSNRMNDAGFERLEAYMEPDPRSFARPPNK